MGITTRRRTRRQLELMERIHALHAAGEALNVASASRNHPDLLAAVMDVRPYWGWRTALESAGITYDRVRVELMNDVACCVCDERRRTLGPHLRSKHRLTCAQYQRLHPGAEVMAEDLRASHFSGAQSSSAWTLPHWEPIWSEVYVLDRLLVLHDAGHAVNPMSVKTNEPRLYWAALTYFGEWDVALRRIGLDPREVRLARRAKHWTQDEVRDALQLRVLQARPMHYAAISRADSSLLGAAVRFYGSYDAALEAAGVTPSDVRRRPRAQTRDDRRYQIIAQIRERHRLGLRMNDNALTRGEADERDASLYSRSRRMFGSWRAAVDATGLDYAAVTRAARP